MITVLHFLYIHKLMIPGFLVNQLSKSRGFKIIIFRREIGGFQIFTHHQRVQSYHFPDLNQRIYLVKTVYNYMVHTCVQNVHHHWQCTHCTVAMEVEMYSRGQLVSLWSEDFGRNHWIRCEIGGISLIHRIWWKTPKIGGAKKTEWYLD